ncbi:MAG: 1,4-dihydroxy-6-naphthoate synthase [Sphingobacteriales bacterium]|jgi:1,4-dihydroxy-6-naphthoate synthase
MDKEITIGFSPCPNDTFIFEALVNKRIDTLGFNFKPILADVEELNQLAIKGKLDITKISYFAFSKVWDNYQLLYSGSALGKGCGPLLISKSGSYKNINQGSIAIPGELTTANFLLNFAYPEAKNKKPMLFSDIEDAVLNESVDLGTIIHENRFTYKNRGLHKVKDLGKHWEDETTFPIPLGGICIKRDFTFENKVLINRLIRESILFAFDKPKVGLEYRKQHAQEMNEEVMLQHINLYVNEHSIDLGTIGVKAVKYLFKKSNDLGLSEKPSKDLFF